ncbi:hypothetical protein MTsPCn5_19220 [Croceitalea sp. MTPC5]|uniref:hypothetical protein n=1 Tax=Croceitalea sp. MTPC5 TaxID=3056565 RepID=UPI002B3FE9F2|nr:hypothetical protein MTsPCn5_19220 [Croceitalea sp. MTPC5]
MAAKNNPKKSTDELFEILSRLHKHGFLDKEEAYFDIIKQEILKREQKEIQKLKKELDELSKQRFKNKNDFFGFLERLLPNLPPYPSIS